MAKRDIYKISESEQPRTLFRKPHRHPLMSLWLWLILVIVAVAIVEYYGLIDAWGPLSSLLKGLWG